MKMKSLAGLLPGGRGTALSMVLCLLGVGTASPAYQQQHDADGQDDAPDRVYLIHADELSYDRSRNRDAQILDGNVAFSHKGATLYCDSAHFYEKSNSFEAFGNVRMYQGDTLSLFSDYAFYDGDELMAEARYNVVLKHRNSTLYTDSLNFDRLYNVGYFFEGGKLVDSDSELTSDWGEYYTETKQAVFNYDVRLSNKKFFLTSDTLYYNTDTSIAHAVGPSDITSGTSHIYTEDGYYNTDLDYSQLFDRSVVTDKGRSMVGDSIYYDSNLGTSEAFGNVVYTDSVNKNMMTCDYYWYDENTGYGMATKRAVAIDFSQRDSLYMHADTFKIFTFNINTDSVYRMVHAYNKVRAYRADVQAVCDSLVYNTADSCLTMYKDPIAWSDNQQVLGEVIKVYMKNSTVDRVHVIGQALSVEQMPDLVNFNQVSSDEMLAFFNNGDISETEANDNVLVVYYPVDDSDSSLIGLNYTETTQLKIFFEKRKMQKVWMPKAEGTLYPMSQIPPYKRFLPNYVWFDYVRPLNKEDIFNWRGKKAGTELKEVKRKEAPLQRIAGASTAIDDTTAMSATPAEEAAALRAAAIAAGKAALVDSMSSRSRGRYSADSAATVPSDTVSVAPADSIVPGQSGVGVGAFPPMSLPADTVQAAETDAVSLPADSIPAGGGGSPDRGDGAQPDVGASVLAPSDDAEEAVAEREDGK